MPNPSLFPEPPELDPATPTSSPPGAPGARQDAPADAPTPTPAERLAAATAALQARAQAGKRTGRPPAAPVVRPTPDPEDVKRARKALARAGRRSLGHELANEAALNAGLVPTPGPGRRGEFVATPQDRARVETMSGLGFPREQIALLVLHPVTNVPVDVKTLEAHFSAELSRGPVLANSKVAESLWKRATAKGKDGSVAAAKWWTEARMGWRAKSVVEVEVRSGVLVPPPTVTPTEWIAAQAAANAARDEPGIVTT